MIVLLYSGERERTEYKNYSGILVSMVGKIYARILVDSLLSDWGFD